MWNWTVLVLVFLFLHGGCVAAETHSKRVSLPAKLKVAAIEAPNGGVRLWTEIEAKFRGGDPAIRKWISRTLKKADEWAARPDDYYVGLFRPESPFGRSTVCCPFHPQMSGWCPFNWDPDRPWRLTCPLCKKEGRKPDYYPNELYPDDGRGCRPTDEVWRKTHNAAWSKKYNIPWERWDGHTHGDIDGFAFFFLGYAQWRIFFELTWRHQILNTLCKAHVFAARLYPQGSPEYENAALYAHKAKLIMVTMTRAIMGDPYLRDVLGMDSTEYRRAVESLAVGPDGKSLPYREYPGYEKRDTISDHSASDPDHPLGNLSPSWWNRAITIFPDHSSAPWARAWLPAYAMIQQSFTPAEREAGLNELVERLLMSKEADAARLEKSGREVKPGIIDLGVKPYNLRMRGNLAGAQALATLNLGLTLGDRQIIRNVVAAIYRYLHGGYFTADGLGFESSPHYTQVALNNIATPLAILNGMKEGFGPGDPFWDPKSESLNPYLDPALERAAYSTLLSVLPDGLCAPWSDSWVTERPNLTLAENVVNATGRVPDRFLPWLNVSKDARGRFRLQLKKALTLPSYCLRANGIAVMRTGVGLDQTFVSVDWSRATGHSHNGPFNLLLYGARHEMLFDQSYLNNVTPTQAWMKSAEAHNTALVRTASGSPRPCVTWRGALRFFSDTPTVKAVEVAEDDQAKLRRGLPADQPVFYQCTVVLLETEAPAQQSHADYVVDIFRLQGGTTHDYYIHSLGDQFALTGAQLKPVADAKLSLYEVSDFTYRTKTGARVITGISRAKTDGDFTATWRSMKDWRTLPPTVDEEAIVQARMLGVPGTEVFVGTAPGQRYIDARDVEQRVTVVCVRRKAEEFRDAPDAFVAVINARRQEADPISQIAQLTVLSGDQAAAGVCITRLGGVDYVLSTTQDDAPTTFGDPGSDKKITLTGRLGVVRTYVGRPAALILLHGTHLTDRQR